MHSSMVSIGSEKAEELTTIEISEFALCEIAADAAAMVVVLLVSFALDEELVAAFVAKLSPFLAMTNPSVAEDEMYFEPAASAAAVVVVVEELTSDVNSY